MKSLINFIFSAICLCFVAQVRGEAIQDATIVDFGIYKGAGETSVDVGNSPSGNVLLGGTVKLVKQTEKIPAKIGVKFGFQFSLSDKEKKRQLKFVYLFPEIKNPKTGQVSTRFEGTGKYNGDGVPVGVLYDFSDPWELVPGEWTFQVFDGDRMLVEKKFTVVKD
jgi:hypothetical protein